MHRSRLQAVIIDHGDQGCDAAVSFWGSALGREPAEAKAPAYYELGAFRQVDVVLQRTADHVTRMHVDIETDDIAAEVARLCRLGATVTEHVEDHVVLRDPGGAVFCVVPVQDAGRFAQGSRSW
jgi:hypothetical protein